MWKDRPWQPRSAIIEELIFTTGSMLSFPRNQPIHADVEYDAP